MTKTKDSGQIKARLPEELARRVAWIFYNDSALTQQSLLTELVEKWVEVKERQYGRDPRLSVVPKRKPA